MYEYKQRIQTLHQQLGIPSDYEQQYGLPLYEEAQELIDVGEDIEGRIRQLTPQAANQWQAMKTAAEKDDIELQIVSAYRSVEYQADIIQYKLNHGQAMEEILKVSAAPGHSEHHTGIALDITTPGYQALEEEFEGSDAFRWLQENAERFLFYLSYPKNNDSKIAYEPWHWAYSQDNKRQE